jgi:hypothetical protein
MENQTMAHPGGFILLTSLAYSSCSSILAVAVVAVIAMASDLPLASTASFASQTPPAGSCWKSGASCSARSVCPFLARQPERLESCPETNSRPTLSAGLLRYPTPNSLLRVVTLMHPSACLAGQLPNNIYTDASKPCHGV